MTKRIFRSAQSASQYHLVAEQHIAPEKNVVQYFILFLKLL